MSAWLHRNDDRSPWFLTVTSKSPLIKKSFSGAEYRGRIAPMIEQDKQSWNKGRADAMRGAPSKCPSGLDKLSYSSGYIEGEAQRAKRPLRVVSSATSKKDDAP